jgi:asparagine synthase (glutamine-hydrolysing)
VAISLSGGNDSTLVAACAARLLPELNPDNPRLRSFSYVFDEYPECDERRFIEPVVASYDIDACYIPADDKWSFADLGRRPVRWDYLWTSCYAQLPIAVAEATRQAGCRTLLNGDYGDALFSGASYFAADLFYSGQLGALLSFARQIPRGQRRQTLFDHGLRLLIPERLKRIYRSARRRPWAPTLQGLSATRLRETQRIRKAARLPTSCAALSPGRRPRCASLLEASWPNAKGAARAGLHAPMAVESCSPYFDRRLVEFVLAVPQEQIAAPGRWRRLQRAAMRRLLPAEVVERTSKTGYAALLRAGLGDKAREKAVNLLEAPLAVEHDWIDASWLTAALAFRRPTDNDLYALSQCLHLELWLRALQDHTSARSSP